MAFILCIQGCKYLHYTGHMIDLHVLMFPLGDATLTLCERRMLRSVSYTAWTSSTERGLVWNSFLTEWSLATNAPPYLHYFSRNRLKNCIGYSINKNMFILEGCSCMRSNFLTAWCFLTLSKKWDLLKNTCRQNDTY